MNIKNRFKRQKTLSAEKRAERTRRLIGLVLGLIFAACIVVLFMHIKESDRLRALAIVEEADKSPIPINRNRDYGESGWNKVAENATKVMYADYTTGEFCVEDKNTGKTWYSNPVDRNEDGIQGTKSKLNSQMVLTYFDVKTERENTADSYANSIRFGGMDHELVENGIKFIFTFPAQGIIIPIQYILNEDGVTVDLLTNEIQEVWSEKNVALEVEVLPFFGAGGLADDGYLFIPDGSGALINFNSPNYRYGGYGDDVYRYDFGLKFPVDNYIKEPISMPVFGVKCNDDAFLAVITSGASNAFIQAVASRRSTSYNQVYSKVILREYQTKGAAVNMNGTEENRNFNECSVNLLGEDTYSIRYYFLEGDQADYAGMSQKYKEYLLEEDLMNDSKLADDNYLILDLYGAISIEKYVMGVKRQVVVPLTTYNDVREIVQKVKARGVENLIVNYIGAMNGGLETMIHDKIITESELGSKKEFKAMVEYLKEEGVLLFMETDPIHIHMNGNGYNMNEHGSETFFDSYIRGREAQVNRRITISQPRGGGFINPRMVPDILSSFAKSAKSYGVNVSAAAIGETAYTDLADGNRFTTRAECVDLWTQAMAGVKKEVDYLMVHGGFIYSAANADVITDVSFTNSDYDTEDSSVPFYQMVMRGNVLMGTKAINMSADYHQAFLKALETGCSLKFNLMAANSTELVRTNYNDMVSYYSEQWLDTAIDEYLDLQSATSAVKGQTIVDHEKLAENVFKTIYESGNSIIVNYNEEAYQYGGHTVAGRGYLVMEGGTQ